MQRRYLTCTLALALVLCLVFSATVVPVVRCEVPAVKRTAVEALILAAERFATYLNKTLTFVQSLGVPIPSVVNSSYVKGLEALAKAKELLEKGALTDAFRTAQLALKYLRTAYVLLVREVGPLAQRLRAVMVNATERAREERTEVLEKILLHVAKRLEKRKLNATELLEKLRKWREEVRSKAGEPLKLLGPVKKLLRRLCLEYCARFMLGNATVRYLNATSTLVLEEAVNKTAALRALDRAISNLERTISRLRWVIEKLREVNASPVAINAVYRAMRNLNATITVLTVVKSIVREHTAAEVPVLVKNLMKNFTTTLRTKVRSEVVSEEMRLSLIHI